MCLTLFFVPQLGAESGEGLDRARLLVNMFAWEHSTEQVAVGGVVGARYSPGGAWRMQ